MTIRRGPRDVVANGFAAPPLGRRSVDVLDRFVPPARHGGLWIGLCAAAVAADVAAGTVITVELPCAS